MFEYEKWLRAGTRGRNIALRPSVTRVVDSIRSLAVPVLRVAFLVLMAALLILVLLPAALAAQAAAAV